MKLEQNDHELIDISFKKTEKHDQLVADVNHFKNSTVIQSPNAIPEWMHQAFEYARTKAQSGVNFSIKDICLIHSYLGLEGKFRVPEFEETCVHFGSDYPYFPPDAGEIPILMEKYEKKYAVLEEEKLLKMICEAYFVFELIHPFKDGNGRTGRLICGWLMIQHGYEYFAPFLEKLWGGNNEHRIRIFSSRNNNYYGCLGNPEILNDHFSQFYLYFLSELINLFLEK